MGMRAKATCSKVWRNKAARRAVEAATVWCSSPNCMTMTPEGSRQRAKSAKQRAQELIAIAHPDFRASLRAEANKLCVF